MGGTACRGVDPRARSCLLLRGSTSIQLDAPLNGWGAWLRDLGLRFQLIFGVIEIKRLWSSIHCGRWWCWQWSRA